MQRKGGGERRLGRWVWFSAKGWREVEQGAAEQGGRACMAQGVGERHGGHGGAQGGEMEEEMEGLEAEELEIRCGVCDDRR